MLYNCSHTQDTSGREQIQSFADELIDYLTGQDESLKEAVLSYRRKS